MDVALFVSPRFWTFIYVRKVLIGWQDCLNVLHKQNGDIQSRLDSLSGKGLLQDSHFSSRRINMHDLYIEFAEQEAKGNFGEATDMSNQKWVYIDNGDLSKLEVTPAGGCWTNLTRLLKRVKFYFEDRLANPITSLEGIEWKHFSNVVMLHLDGLRSLQGILNLKGMKCLRILRLQALRRLERLEGFSELTNLMIFEWETGLLSSNEIGKTNFVGNFPTSLEFLCITGKRVVLEPNVLARCYHLCKLLLNGVDVGELLDLSSCSSLNSVYLYFMQEPLTKVVLCTSKASKLKSFSVRWEHLSSMRVFMDIAVAIRGLDQAVGLKCLHLRRCSFDGLPRLLTLTKLRSLKLDGHGRFPELCIPHQVKELYYEVKGSIEAPFLNGFEQLQVLDLFRSQDLTHLFGMGDLPALRSLNLQYCSHLERCPNLNASRRLEDLNLDFCFALKLHVEDIQLLAKLPLLHPMRFSKSWGIRLDLAKQKVLRHIRSSCRGLNSLQVWEEGDWKEEELGQPPIGILKS